MSKAKAPARASMSARSVEVRGVVRGVGFRPFVWRLADRHRVTGWVRNRNGVVEILAEGLEPDLDAFCDAISAEAPPLARVEDVRWSPARPAGFATFELDESMDEGAGERLISPDVATCINCLGELFDPDDRRYRYPFINCKDCGPRFTIIEALPYERERTSMRAFPMCADCEREYRDPAGRRFHAEPVACPACGPRLRLVDAKGMKIAGDPVEKAAALLHAGKIVALKGLGGFHLACSAIDERVVTELRARKHRTHEPFAVMVEDLDVATERFDLAPSEEQLLASPQAPIALVKDKGTLAPSVAPGHRRQGVMLPSTPLHHLLLREVGLPLVMISGNLTDEPTCIDDQEALRRLAGVADAFVLHDRQIVARYDDSVTRCWRSGPVVLRRGRSFAPSPLELSTPVKPILGVGAQLHGAFCLAAGTRAFLSQHIGDLDTEEAMDAYADAYRRHKMVFGIEPEAVAHDLHPDFLSTRFAEETGLQPVGVQHHHAHVAATMAEYGLEGQVIGVAFDGSGLGEDGTAWGGEFFSCDASHAERLGHLRPVRQPGGDAVVLQPWRMAIAYAEDADVLDAALGLLEEHVPEDADELIAQLRAGIASPFTTAGGRLFDAVSSLAGVCHEATHEGQPAMLLEQTALSSATREYAFDVQAEEGRLVVDTRPIVSAIVKDLVKGRAPGEVAGRFHRTLAAAILEVCRAIRGGSGLSRVCLGGDIFQNDLLVSDATSRLETCDFEVYVPRQTPVGDGGLALGQVLVANARLEG